MAAVFKSFHDIHCAVLSRTLLPTVSSPKPRALSTSFLRHFSYWNSISIPARVTPVSVRTRRFTVTATTSTQSADPISQSSTADNRVPVTVITGFLGSGKTTLLNYVLKADHGKRLAVIENEFGEVDIDGSLVAAQKTGLEDIMVLNNGCLCCTVRGDLVRMISDLVQNKRDMFDHILIETTGLANPSPIIQTFYMEEKLAPHVRLDGVLTLVDAKHAPLHLDEIKPDGVVNEAVQQIAYADRILLNKIDLVSDKDLQSLAQRIKSINEMARIQYTKYSTVDLDYVLGIGGFDLERIEKEIMEEKPAKTHKHEHHHDHEHDLECDANCDHEDHGHHAKNQEHKHDHSHDPGVSSVSIVCDGTLDLEKINFWLGTLLSERNDDIFRCKGVLSVDGIEQRYVFQAVHALYEGGTDRLWGSDEKRTNKLIFIGRKLEKEALEKGFKSCLK